MIRAFILGFLFSCMAAPLAAKPVAHKPHRPALVSAEFDCDALSINSPLDAATTRDLGPAHSLDAAAAVLTKHGVKFERSQGVMTLNGIPARIVHDINYY